MHEKGLRSGATRAIVTVRIRTVSEPRMHSYLQSLRDEAGEGVISTAIAVLVMAFIGAAMWVAFSGTFNTASQTIDQQVQQVGG